MVVKILKVKLASGRIDNQHVAVINKTGSFSKIFDVNEQLQNLMDTYGALLYINAVPNKEGGLDFKGIVNGRF